MTRTLVLFAAGVALLFPFDYTLTIIGGVALLVASIVSGVFELLTPERLRDPSGE